MFDPTRQWLVDVHVQKILALSSADLNAAEILAALAVALFGIKTVLAHSGEPLHPDVKRFLYLGEQILAESLQRES